MIIFFLKKIFFHYVPEPACPYDSVVCIKHFVSDYIVTIDQATHADGSILCVSRTVPKLTDDAVLTILNNLPKYLSSQPAKMRKRQTKDKLN